MLDRLWRRQVHVSETPMAFDRCGDGGHNGVATGVRRRRPPWNHPGPGLQAPAATPPPLREGARGRPRRPGARDVAARLLLPARQRRTAGSRDRGGFLSPAGAHTRLLQVFTPPAAPRPCTLPRRARKVGPGVPGEENGQEKGRERWIRR